MSLFGKLFGGGGAKADAAVAETYKDFQIIPTPVKESGGYRIAATITKTVDGVDKTHKLVRADTITDLDEAIKASVGKAQQMINEQGDRIFD